MRYSLTMFQPKEKIEKTDEIIASGSQENLFILLEKYPNKDILFDIDEKEKIDWNSLSMFKEKFNNFIVRTNELNIIKGCKEYDIPFMLANKISTYEQLCNALKQGVYQVFIDAPLTFELPEVKRICDSIPIRVQPNKTNFGYLGFYIRPEDISLYEPYIDIMEFYHERRLQEGQLFEIYSIDKEWLGNLNLLITNLNYNVDNRFISKDFAPRRINCGQKCLKDTKCIHCATHFNFAREIINVNKISN